MFVCTLKFERHQLSWGLNENVGRFFYVQASIRCWTPRDAVSWVSLLTPFAAQRLNSCPAHHIPRYLQLPPTLMKPQNMDSSVEVHLPLLEKDLKAHPAEGVAVFFKKPLIWITDKHSVKLLVMRTHWLSGTGNPGDKLEAVSILREHHCLVGGPVCKEKIST